MMTECLLTGVQLLLAGAAIWYAIETRRMRLQNEEQMQMLRSQTRLSVAPHLIPGMVDVDLARLRKQTEEDKELSEEDKAKRLSEIDEARVKFVCAVRNPTARVPMNCNVWTYDVRTRSFLLGDFGKEYIDEKDSELFQISEPYYSREQVLSQMTARYGKAAGFVEPHVKVGDASYLVLLFRDLEGRLYCFKRQFEIRDDNEISHRPVEVYFEGA